MLLLGGGRTSTIGLTVSTQYRRVTDWYTDRGTDVLHSLACGRAITFACSAVRIEFVSDLALAAISADRIDTNVLTAVVPSLAFVVLWNTHTHIGNVEQDFIKKEIKNSVRTGWNFVKLSCDFVGDKNNRGKVVFFSAFFTFDRRVVATKNRPIIFLVVSQEFLYV